MRENDAKPEERMMPEPGKAPAARNDPAHKQIASHSAWPNIKAKSPALVSGQELAIYEQLRLLTAQNPVLYPVREPNPLMGNDAMLEIILDVPKFPAEQLTDVSLGVGDAWLYERHMFEAGSPLRQSQRVLAFQGPVAAGEYMLKLSTQRNVLATKDNPSANLQRKVLIEPGKLCSYAIRLASKEADISVSTMPASAEVEIRLKLGGNRQFESCAMWLGDMLLFDEATNSVTYHRQRMRPEIRLGELAEVCVFKGLLPEGLHALRFEARVVTEGEVDARPAALQESIRLVSGMNAPLVFQLPETTRHASAEQQAKGKRIQALRGEIITKMNAGAEYSEGDKEGGWLRIFFRGGGFFSESGSYAEGINYGTSPVSEDKVVDRLLELNAVYLRGRPLEDRLLYVRDSLRVR